MNLESPRAVLGRAQQAWKSNASDNQRIVLFYTLPALILPLIVMAINLLLDWQLDSTGGLSGIDRRNTLETIQAVLSTAVRLVLPFWQLGLVYCAMAISREQKPSKNQLFEGFHRWSAALRLMLLRTFRYTFGCLGGIFLGSAIYTMTPLSNTFFAASQTLANDPSYANATAEELMAAVINLTGFGNILLYYILCILGLALFFIPLFYRYRMSNYILLDSEHPQALLSIHESTRMMRGNAVRLFKLDLHLWWYYLLAALTSVIAYGDLLLPLLGVTLPFSEQWAFVIFALLSTAVQLAVYYLFAGQVETVYACAYESLKASEGGNETL